MDTIGSPSSGRASIDKAVSFLYRGKSIDELDAAASRAASIRALRAAYNEKEEAKEAKYEKEAMKQASKRAKKEERQRRKSDAASARVRSESGADSGNTKTEIVGKAYADYNNTHTSSLPKVEASRPKVGTNASRGSSNRGAKSTWVKFLAWLRTRFLRWGGKMHGTQ
jgi:hypothetical protein